MRFQNIVISGVFTLILYWVYISRYDLDPIAFPILLFGLLIAGGLYVWREVLSREKVKSDERTEVLAGKAARYTLVSAFGLVILILAFLTVTDRPTSANGVLAILVGILAFVYSVSFEYLKLKH